jgi:hypothetical protein
MMKLLPLFLAGLTGGLTVGGVLYMEHRHLLNFIDWERLHASNEKKT